MATHTPPNKANLKAWWNHFNFVQKTKKEAFEGPYRAHDTADHPVFGKPLKESLRYASVQISTADANGELYVWGFIPVVVAKCGLYLKETATEVQGTFRVNGSNKRMRDLQAAFETPPRYGKSLDWKNESYTTHDVASVFRRYLTQMPEPVIPYDMYHPFRDALAKQPYNQEEVIATYKALIRRMPRANQYLLLYVLDLLSVFARKSDKNLMTATNLAVIFRPGIIAHPEHEMSPHAHALSQKVLEFLIAHQDWFMLDIIPPLPPGGYPGDDTTTDDAQGGSASGPGGPGGWGGAGPSRGAGPPGPDGGGGGPTGKWREGVSTPTRQGAADGGAWGASAEAGSSLARHTTTRQRVISGGPEVGAWYAHGRGGSGSTPGLGYGGQSMPSAPQMQRRESYSAYPQARAHSPPLPPTPAPARQTAYASEQQGNSYFSAKNASSRPNISPNAHVPDGQRLYTNAQWEPAGDGGGSVFVTPMSSMPPSPGGASGSGHQGGSSTGHGQRQGQHLAQQEQQSRQLYAPPQQQQQEHPPPQPQSQLQSQSQQRQKSGKKTSVSTYPTPEPPSSSSQPGLGSTPIHAKFAQADSVPAAAASQTAVQRSAYTPPPTGGLAFAGVAPPLGSGASDVDDVMIISDQEEETSYVGGDAWRLVSRDGLQGAPATGFISLGRKEREGGKGRETAAAERSERERLRMIRRRTAMDRIEPFMADPISPILEAPVDTAISGDGIYGVVRSRTLPSRRKNGESGLGDKENANGGLGASASPAVDGGARAKDRTKDRDRGEKRVLKKQRRVSSANRV